MGAALLLSGLLPAFNAGVAQVYEDNFNAADGSLGAAWQALLGNFAISGNRAGPTTNTDTVAMYSAAPVLGNQWAQVEWRAGAVNAHFPGVACMLAADGAGGRGYIYANDGTGGSGNGLFRFDATNGFTLLQNEASTWAAGDVMRIEAANGTVRVLKNGTQIVSVANAVYTSGKPGMYAYGNAARQDNWKGGAL